MFFVRPEIIYSLMTILQMVEASCRTNVTIFIFIHRTWAPEPYVTLFERKQSRPRVMLSIKTATRPNSISTLHSQWTVACSPAAVVNVMIHCNDIIILYEACSGCMILRVALVYLLLCPVESNRPFYGLYGYNSSKRTWWKEANFRSINLIDFSFPATLFQ